jgi:hypothetical protein
MTKTKTHNQKKPPQRQKSTDAVKPKRKGEQAATETARADVPDAGEEPITGDEGAKSRS